MNIYPSYLYTLARNYLLDYRGNMEVPQDAETFEAWEKDLGEEIEAAVSDRIYDWERSRKLGLPLGELEGVKR